MKKTLDLNSANLQVGPSKRLREACADDSMDLDSSLNLIRLLLTRLERISVDSYWAHRASGLRGSLLKTLESLERGQPVQRSKQERLIASGFRILEAAMREKRGWKGIRE